MLAFFTIDFHNVCNPQVLTAVHTQHSRIAVRNGWSPPALMFLCLVLLCLGLVPEEGDGRRQRHALAPLPQLLTCFNPWGRPAQGRRLRKSSQSQGRDRKCEGS